MIRILSILLIPSLAVAQIINISVTPGDGINHVKWTYEGEPCGGETGYYYLYRSSAGNSVFTIYKTFPGNMNSFDDYQVDNGNTYSYKIVFRAPYCMQVGSNIVT